MTSVLHIITGLGAGGAENMLVQVASGLQARGLPQHVVSLTGRDSRAKAIESAGIPVTALQLRRGIRSLADGARLIALVARLRPDVIQGWMYHADLASTVAHILAPGRKSRRLFWGIRASDMDSARYARVVRWCARLSRWPDVVTANSAAGARVHVEHGYRPRRLEIIPNGVDIALFRPDEQRRLAARSELGISPDACVVIHSARVDPMKDHATLLAALARVPTAIALLVGEGTKSLKKQDNVIPLGLRDDLERLYPAADVVISSSAYGEGFSNALAEGMSCGLVPITTMVGDAESIVGDTGLIVAPHDVDGLSAAIRAELERPAAERHARGLRARTRVIEHFTIERAVDEFQSLYES